LSGSRARPDPDFIIHGFSEALLTTQIFLRRLHRNMPQQELNLFQFASGFMTKTSAGPGYGSRVYAAPENTAQAAVIDTLTNQVIANVPIGQTTQALVYVPNAVAHGAGTDNLVPIGEAGITARLRPEAGGTAAPNAQGWAAVNSLGLLDLVQIAADGLAPHTQYQVYLTDSEHSPFGLLLPLAVLRTNLDGGGIVQAVGPLKALAGGAAAGAGVHPQRFLIVTELNNPSQVVLVESSSSGFSK
jgi:hypothetical protein